jgi:hypothetical protein
MVTKNDVLILYGIQQRRGLGGEFYIGVLTNHHRELCGLSESDEVSEAVEHDYQRFRNGLKEVLAEDVERSRPKVAIIGMVPSDED